MGVLRRIRYALFLRLTSLSYTIDHYAGLSLRHIVGYRAALSGDTPEVWTRGGFQFRVGTPDDIARMRLKPGEREALASRLRGGDIMVTAAGGGGEVCGCLWIALSSANLSELGKRVDLGPGEAWIYDLYVFPPYRNSGVGRGMLGFALAFLRERGFSSAYANVERGNTPSRKVFERVGFRPYKETTYLHLFGLKRYSEHAPGT